MDIQARGDVAAAKNEGKAMLNVDVRLLNINKRLVSYKLNLTVDEYFSFTDGVLSSDTPCNIRSFKNGDEHLSVKSGNWIECYDDLIDGLFNDYDEFYKNIHTTKQQE